MEIYLNYLKDNLQEVVSLTLEDLLEQLETKVQDLSRVKGTLQDRLSLLTKIITILRRSALKITHITNLISHNLLRMREQLMKTVLIVHRGEVVQVTRNSTLTK